MKSILGAFDGVNTKKKNKDDLRYIYYKDIRPASKNRDTGDITQLAEDIAEDGLDHNIILREIDDEDFKYEIVAGHRRYLAICFNIKNGDLTYEYIPSKIKEYDNIDGLRRLHMNNINTKPYTSGEMFTAIEDLKEIYRIKKERGEKVPGRVQELIAKDTGLGKTQVGNYEKVINNAVDDVKDKLKNNEITLSEALEIASMNEENQLKFIEENDGQISITTIAEYKDSLTNDDSESDFMDEYTDDDYFNKMRNDEYNQINETQEDNIIESEKLANKDNISNEADRQYSVQELVIEIQTYLYLLKNKISGVEWKKEQAIMEEMLKLIADLKSSTGV